jgi:hypothetical protein
MAVNPTTEDVEMEMADVHASEEGNAGGGAMDDGAAAAAAGAQPFHLDDGTTQPSTLDGGDGAEEEHGSSAEAAHDPFSLDARRRLKQEAYVTRGCGKNEVKARTVNTFWETVWPALELLGWIKVR